MRGMKVKDADILIVPGYTNSGPDHWQTRWEQKLSTARRVEQAEWSKPVREDWTEAVVRAVNEAERPVVFIAHSLGVPTVVHAVPRFEKPIASGLVNDAWLLERVLRFGADAISTDRPHELERERVAGAGTP